MTLKFRAPRAFLALLLAPLLAAPALGQALAQPVSPPASPAAAPAVPPGAQTGDVVPWIYRGSDVPQDKAWLFGELDNGLRYAVRRNNVPPSQVSIRIRIDAGSLYERDGEEGFAHLMEHLTFRESKYLGEAQAIPTWQRLGASFGSDTNAQTTPTQTVYQLDLPGVTPAKFDQSMKLLSGMIREPVLSQANLDAEVPIVLAEKRERGGGPQRVADRTRKILFAGQRLAERLPIGTEASLRAAKAAAMQAFHDRWYRPENTVIVIVGDGDPVTMGNAIARYFGDWKGKGAHVDAPDFGDPAPPANADPANPIGELGVVVEPNMPRSLTYAVMRKWRPVNDTIKYNEGLLLDAVARAIINRRLEARARSGGKFLFAQVQQDDVSRSADATFINLAPLDGDWKGALEEVRALIADALARPPSQQEIDREYAEFDIAFASELEQKSVLSSAKLAGQIVQAVDIRESVAAPETVLNVLRAMKARFNPREVFAHTQSQFKGDVIRGVYVTPSGDGDTEALRLALSRKVAADASARPDASSIKFADLPAIGKPGEIASRAPIGLFDIEQVNFKNGVRALVWSNDAEPGRVTLKVRFGAGYRGFSKDDAAYIALGKMALVGSGVGELGQEALDRLSTGRKLGFDFDIEDADFALSAQTRRDDLADQLYLFAAKLATPRWDANPVLRAKAAAKLAYDSLATSPTGVLNRDLDFLLKDRDPRYFTPDPAMLDKATPQGFRTVWEPLLKQGPVEVLLFGDFDREAAIESLRRTFGALAPREPLSAQVAAKVPRFPASSKTPTVLFHRGDPDQAAAVIAWPSGGGVAGLPESRQLEILAKLFNNRLLDAMREHAGAAYAPQVVADWPSDLPSGGTITAYAQLKPEDVPVFFAEAQRIAKDLAASPPGADELGRVTEPLHQLISRASTGNNFWLYHLEGATRDPRRIGLIRSLLADYTRTSGPAMQALAAKYLSSRTPFRLAVIPQGQSLAQAVGGSKRAAQPGGR